MKKNFILLAFSICFLSAAYGQFTNKTMMVGTASRAYRQYLPSGFNPSAEPGLPLIIAMHGLGDNYTNFSNVGFHYIADTARFLVVYPNGTLNAWSQNSWNNGTILSSTANDIGFLWQIIDTMKVKYNIDLAKVYVTGFSMGGIMSYRTLCGMPERIAALASVSGTMSSSDISTCDPGRAVPVMHLHGTADGTVPYTGGLPSLSSVSETMAFWQDNNGCSDSTVTPLPNLVASDSITVDLIDYNMCGKPVQLWRENNADHIWPYYPVNDITAVIEIWLFFRDKTHPSPSPLSVMESNARPTITLAQTQGAISIEADHEMLEISICDVQGRNLVQLKGQLGNLQKIAMEQYNSQTCIVNVKTVKGSVTKKFVLVK